jgi:hypothetical protein
MKEICTPILKWHGAHLSGTTTRTMEMEAPFTSRTLTTLTAVEAELMN